MFIFSVYHPVYLKISVQGSQWGEPNETILPMKSLSPSEIDDLFVTMHELKEDSSEDHRIEFTVYLHGQQIGSLVKEAGALEFKGTGILKRGWLDDPLLTFHSFNISTN